MMRRIKFRAWDKDNKKFLSPYREQHIGNWVNTLSINMDGSLSFHEDDGFGGKSIGGENIEKRFEIMQYTGLKDIKGDDVYHGNLCLYDRNINGKKDKEVFVVEYQDGAFFMESNTERVYLHDVPETQESIEVIGNVYENPELLGDNQ